MVVIGFLAVLAAFVAPFVTRVDQLSTGLPQAISDAQPVPSRGPRTTSSSLWSTGTVQIPSLTVLIAVLCGGAALGLIGAPLAIPIAGTIQAVAGELLEERAERINGVESG